METLQIIWFLLIAVLLIGYSILDGFDLGVGVIHLFTKDETEKRKNLNAIGPIWDGNEVWLLTGGGALFAAFPIVYATVFSGFYLALMLLLLALIMRAVSMEFRSKVESQSWRKLWDLLFGIGSLVPALLFGVAFGNILRGIPLEKDFTFVGSFFGLLNPFSLLVGLLSLTTFTLHGAIYLCMKVETDQEEKIRKYIPKLYIAFVILYLLVTFFAIFEAKFLFASILKNPLFYLLFILLLASVIYLPVAVNSRKYGLAFISSSVIIASAFGIAAVSLFPRIVPSSINLDYSLTIFNSSSTEPTLYTMLIIALIGMPLVIGYTIFIYRQFKGKVILTEDSY